jgi:hypothetical protein
LSHIDKSSPKFSKKFSARERTIITGQSELWTTGAMRLRI